MRSRKLDEFDWERFFREDRRPSPGSSELDPGGDLLGIDGLVTRYRAAYPDEKRGSWIEQRLRTWFSQREADDA